VRHAAPFAHRISSNMQRSGRAGTFASP
jgi:hypothetical protein